MSPINENIYTVNLFRRLDRFVDIIVTRKRREIFARIFETGAVRLDLIASVLDVGSTKDRLNESSNFFARQLSETSSVTLFSDQQIDTQRDIDFAVAGVLVGDASRIGPDTGTYDLVLSSATIEHVGTVDDQRRMIACCIRAARRYVIITTPNRWHPLEFHTRLPLLHWLPRRWHRRLLKAIGFDFFAEENNLNLLDRHELRTMIDVNEQRERIKSCQLETIRLFGLVSNLVFILELKE
jgi:hypothetical protein